MNRLDFTTNGLLYPLTKGDVKGHDFHGNQWTGGIGSEKVAEIQKRLAKAAGKLTKKAFENEAERQRIGNDIGNDIAAWRLHQLNEAGYKTLEAYQKASAQAIKDYVAKGDIVVSVLTPEKNLAAILNSGEIQNGYVSGKSERGYADNMGTRNDVRMQMENEAFGLTMKSPLSERPVYGFVDQKGLRDDPAGYGNAKIVLNPDIKERSTVTLGDSLDTFTSDWTAKFGDTTAPLLASDPNPKDIFYPVQIDSIPEHLTTEETPFSPNLSPSYMEAQIHGGLTTSDIARVDFYAQPSPEVEAALKAKNIPYRTNIRD
jgi:hypothetical protein